MAALALTRGHRRRPVCASCGAKTVAMSADPAEAVGAPVPGAGGVPAAAGQSAVHSGAATMPLSGGGDRRDPRGAASFRVGHAVGRKRRDIRSELVLQPGEGGICKHCRKLVKARLQNGTLTAKHLCASQGVPLLVRNEAWEGCATLQKTNPRPFECHLRASPGITRPRRQPSDI